MDRWKDVGYIALAAIHVPTDAYARGLKLRASRNVDSYY